MPSKIGRDRVLVVGTWGFLQYQGYHIGGWIGLFILVGSLAIALKLLIDED